MMPSYCLLADLQNYLGTSASPDAALLQRMLDAASARIESFTGRSFYAAADSTRYHDYGRFIDGELPLGGDLAYLTSVVNGDAANITSDCYLTPRRGVAYAIGLLTSSTVSWTYEDDMQSAIAVTGRWAFMDRTQFTAIARATNVVTATAGFSSVSVGQSIEVVGVADASFNGTFTVTATSAGSISWAQTAADDTDTIGSILSAPLDIVHACRRLASWLYRQKDNQSGDNDRPILAGDGSVIMPTTLPGDVADILMPYVRQVYNV